MMRILLFVSACLISACYSNTCRDNYDNCKSLGKVACENPTVFTWVFHNCAMTCDLCRYYIEDRMTYPTVVPTTTTKAPCTDVYDRCGVYISACGQSQFMRDYCKKTCGECAPPAPTEVGKSMVFG